MTDIVDKATRRRMMSGIRSKDTKPELLVRKALFAQGLRYRLHAKNLPGTPDLVFPAYKAAIFVHGCFWHGHDCRYFKLPSTNTAFWEEKIGKNKQRDALAQASLRKEGWRIMVVWECELKGKHKDHLLAMLASRLVKWIKEGKQPGT